MKLIRVEWLYWSTKKTYCVYLFWYESVTLRAWPIVANSVWSRAKFFGFCSKQLHRKRLSTNFRNVEMNVIVCIGLKFGQWYNNLSKITVDCFFVKSKRTTMTINEKIKISTKQKTVELWEWIRNTILRCFIYMDSVVAILFWINTREPSCGFLTL